jgi:hypothetical protein
VSVGGGERVSVAGDVLEHVVDLVVEDHANGSCRCLSTDNLASHGLSFGRGDVELAMNAVRWCVLSANPQLLLEPFHRIWSFQRPDDVDCLGDSFRISHALDQV